jgi:hypothetical protein
LKREFKTVVSFTSTFVGASRTKHVHMHCTATLEAQFDNVLGKTQHMLTWPGKSCCVGCFCDVKVCDYTRKQAAGFGVGSKHVSEIWQQLHLAGHARFLFSRYFKRNDV